MEKQRSKNALLIWVLLAGLVSHNMVMLVASRNLEEGFNDQKHYYSPYPHKSPPKGHEPPSCGTPPDGGGGYPNPPPTPSYGGSPPVVTPPTIVSPPRCCGQSPPVVTPPTIVSPPRCCGQSPPSITPPYIEPGTPSTPMIPNTPPFIIGTCTFWKTHPTWIWGLFGYWGTVGGVFGVPTLGSSLSLQQALANTRSDGMGSLYREGSASLLNSMVSNKFPYTTQQVKDSFVAALSSDKAAAAQAQLFKQANEGQIKLRP
ncbi:hypothetical protein AAC387_Pa12g2137 [Persea americana]